MSATAQAAALAAAVAAQTDALARLRAMIEAQESARALRLAELREAGAALVEAIDNARKGKAA